MATITNILLTGLPRVGKTTVIQRVVESTDLPFGGFYTQEMREGEQRIGFKIITLDGDEGILAHIRTRSRYRVGRYGVNIEDMQRVAMPAIERALNEGKVIVIDEIARMELYCPGFDELVQRCLNSYQPVLAVIQKKALPFLNKIRQRPDIELHEVTPFNRNELPGQLAKRLWELWLQWRSSLQRMLCSGN